MDLVIFNHNSVTSWEKPEFPLLTSLPHLGDEAFVVSELLPAVDYGMLALIGAFPERVAAFFLRRSYYDRGQNEKKEYRKVEEEYRKRVEERRLERKREFELGKLEARQKTENETRIREASHKEKEARLRAEEEARPTAEEEARPTAEEETRLKAEEKTRLKAEEEANSVEEIRKAEEERRVNEIIALEEEMKLEKGKWHVNEQMRHVQEEHKARMKAEEQEKKEDEEKGLSRDSSNVPLISAEDGTYEEKEETPVDMIKDKAKGDINPVILSKETLDLEDNEIEEEKNQNCLRENSKN
ncbi:hypothetical protein TNCV_1183941 [Trichonephila clavipes]|nr:hypothetical protein TNCV_1183941 [Trichonephila clavipes]